MNLHMATLWITYAWEDNRSGDVDFYAQELEAAGLRVKLDRWNIAAGGRLWDQIARFITDPAECDTWLLVATVHSLQSEACKEEFAYALDRALSQRGATFPVIALFPGDVDRDLIPPGIRTRLYVSITDPDWKERIVAAAEGRQHQVRRNPVDPYEVRIWGNQPGQKPYAIELRPRAGAWAPLIAAVPLAERENVKPSIMVGPRGVPTGTGILVNAGEGPSPDGTLWLMVAGNQATPTQSCFIWCKALPSEIVFGVNGDGRQQYRCRVQGLV